MNIPHATRKALLIVLDFLLLTAATGPGLSNPGGIPEGEQTSKIPIHEVLLKTIHESNVAGRNPQTFVDIYRAREEDFRSAVHTVYRSRRHPSHLRLSVIAGE